MYIDRIWPFTTFISRNKHNKNIRLRLYWLRLRVAEAEVQTSHDILNFWLSRDIMIFSPVIFTPGIRTLLVILLVTTLPSAHVQRALPVYISAILF